MVIWIDVVWQERLQKVLLEAAPSEVVEYIVVAEEAVEGSAEIHQEA